MAAQPHVVILSSPGLGHVTPLLELAKHLVTCYCFQVSFLMSQSESSTGREQVCQSACLPSGLNIVNLPPPDLSNVVVDDNDLLGRIFLNVKQTIHSLQPVLQQFHNVTVFIVDMFFIEAIDVIKELSIPTYIFFTCSANLLASLLSFPTLDQELKHDFSGVRILNFPGCKAIPVTDLFDSIVDRRVLPMASRFPEAAGILMNAWEELEPITLHALRENLFFIQRPTTSVCSRTGNQDE
ncbi:unnamed protein product [Ilex paraguariensis]|uniref:Uncharacterized protein n=1 Tax=Ilex paraguariensis TaxID=185542 RepID=A0ABC8U9V8_9AQUA